VCRLDQISLDDKVVPNEVGWPSAICSNAAYPGRGYVNLLGPISAEKLLYCVGVEKI
jgi:hypothetical protein